MTKDTGDKTSRRWITPARLFVTVREYVEADATLDRDKTVGDLLDRMKDEIVEDEIRKLDR